jgi:radical SAM protein with 4Fe4S-binding SPASM domain
VPFIVKSALLPPNKPEMAEFEAWAKRIPWMTRSPSYAMFFDLRSRRDSAGKNRLIESLRLSPQEGVAVLVRDEPEYSREMVKFASKFLGRPGRQLFPCGAGHDVCVDAYGCAHPCLGIRAPELMRAVVGNSGSRGLAGALTHFTALGELQAADPEYLSRCALCFLKGLCEQCPAKSWTEHGTLDRPVECLCQVTHAQARYLGWLGEDEHGWEVRDWQGRIEMAAQ